MAEMTSRERVLTVFEHREPDRVPRWCGASPEFREKACRELCLADEELSVRFGDDFRRVFSVYSGPEFPLSPGAESRTIFGIERSGIGYGQPMSHPLASADLCGIENYAWPDPGWIDVSGIAEEAAGYGGQYAILGGDWSPFWHDAIDLVGMESLYLKMFDDPNFVDLLFSHIVDFYYEVSQRIFEVAAHEIDIFFIGNDFGGQTGPLLSPALFDRFIIPHLISLVELGHRYGLKVQLHCCGGLSELFPAMIAGGLDAIHAVQPDCRGMELGELKREYGGSLVFNGAIDSHHALIKGTPETVIAETKRVLDIMMPGGGYIGGASHDYILGETPVENVVAMFDTIAEYGVYSQK
ncbi:uroporphyrinogen decarboxylase family protein [Candidatus Latescibacterota bacterium]